MRTATQRIGIFGGSFDPVHIGHLVAATNARHVASLDHVLMMVANIPWQKATSRQVASAEVRFAAVKAAVEGHPELVASRMEIDRGGDTYTIDTVRELGRLFPGAELALILGTDAAAGLETWNQWRELAALTELVVVTRPGSPVPVFDPVWRYCTVEIPALNVSSSDLRKRLEDGRPLDFLIPDPAVEVLRAHLVL